MAQTGFTPIQIYSSSTAAAAPLVANLTNSTLGSELAINITDGKLFYKDNANAIQVIGWKVVPATAGGTGQTSYAVGDLLYADTTTSLAKLADVATGNALISGGVGVAPTWGKIGLTTHVSGTLAVGNGGTGATTFTAGQVLFGNSTSAINTSANLFWDNANARLGIGTASPTVALDVVGAINLTGNAVFGDAATDTVRVNGYMGVGGAASTAYNILATGASTSGANQYSVGVTATLGGTTWSSAYLAGMTIAASTTASSGAGLRVINPTLGSGAAIGTNYGVRVDDLTVGTNNYGVGLAVSSGTNKYNIYANGTAANYFAGNLLAATTTGQNATLTIGNNGNTGNAARLGLLIAGGDSNGASYPFVGYNMAFTATSTINYHSGDTAAAIQFGRSGGEIQTYTAASGTGGNAISFTAGPYVAQGGTSWTNSSDERLKNIQGEITGALDMIDQFRAVYHTWKSDATQKRRVSLIAQDLLPVLPEAVSVPTTEFEERSGERLYMGIEYDYVIPVLVAAIKDLRAEFNAYKTAHP
jgi:hypothetical protein